MIRSAASVVLTVSHSAATTPVCVIQPSAPSEVSDSSASLASLSATPSADTLSRTPPLITPPTPDSVFCSAHWLCCLWRQRHHVHPDFTETSTDKDCSPQCPLRTEWFMCGTKCKMLKGVIKRCFCDQVFPESTTWVEAINHQASFDSEQSKVSH